MTKSINLCKVLAGYILSRIFHRVYQWGEPVSLSIEPTNCCNLHCPECPSGMNQLTREKGQMDISLYRQLIDEVSRSIFYLNLYFQGEPYLHSRFTEMVTYAKSKNIFVSTSTNGHFLTPENAGNTIASGLDNLIIALDGTDAETYDQYRIGGNFNRVIEGIREIANQKKELKSKKPKLILQFLVLKSNQHQVKTIKKLGKELGVDKVVLKTAQFYGFEKGNPLIPDDPSFSRYKKLPESTESSPRYAIRNRLPDHCFRMWSSSVVTWEGTVVPCCFDKDAAHNMGNVKEEPFRKIWNNETYRRFRKTVLTSRKSIDICNNCTEGSGVSFFL